MRMKASVVTKSKSLSMWHFFIKFHCMINSVLGIGHSMVILMVRVHLEGVVGFCHCPCMESH